MHANFIGSTHRGLSQCRQNKSQTNSLLRSFSSLIKTRFVGCEISPHSFSRHPRFVWRLKPGIKTACVVLFSIEQNLFCLWAHKCWYGIMDYGTTTDGSRGVGASTLNSIGILVDVVVFASRDNWLLSELVCYAVALMMPYAVIDSERRHTFIESAVLYPIEFNLFSNRKCAKRGGRRSISTFRFRAIFFLILHARHFSLWRKTFSFSMFAVATHNWQILICFPFANVLLFVSIICSRRKLIVTSGVREEEREKRRDRWRESTEIRSKWKLKKFWNRLTFADFFTFVKLSNKNA